MCLSLLEEEAREGLCLHLKVQSPLVTGSDILNSAQARREREGIPWVVELFLNPHLAGKSHLVLSLVSLIAFLAALSQLVVSACEKQQAKCQINFNYFRNIHFSFESGCTGRLL